MDRTAPSSVIVCPLGQKQTHAALQSSRRAIDRSLINFDRLDSGPLCVHEAFFKAQSEGRPESNHTASNANVCVILKSGYSTAQNKCPLVAHSGLMQRSKKNFDHLVGATLRLSNVRQKHIRWL